MKFKIYSFTDRKSWPRYKGVIYGILCQQSGKIYTGKTVDIRTRWRGHANLLRINSHPNYLLQDNFCLYGENNFCFIVLEKDIVEENLLIREAFWIKTLCCMHYQHGFNLAEPDENGNRINYGKDYDLVNPNGEKIKIRNLFKFCRDNNLSYGQLLKVAMGMTTQHKGYTPPNLEIPDDNFIEVRLLSPLGELLVVNDRLKFEKERGLIIGTISKIASGKFSHIKGWSLVEMSPEDSKKRIKYLRKIGVLKYEKDIKEYKMFDPDKNLHTFTDMRHFSNDQNLTYECLLDVATGNRPFHYGWHLAEPKI
jgi:hypothetical protein